jgi:hypothetical protein
MLMAFHITIYGRRSCMGEELHRLQAEENSGRGSANKLLAVPTISV